MEGLEFSRPKKSSQIFSSPDLEVSKKSKIIEIGAPTSEVQLIRDHLLWRKNLKSDPISTPCLGTSKRQAVLFSVPVAYGCIRNRELELYRLSAAQKTEKENRAIDVSIRLVDPTLQKMKLAYKRESEHRIVIGTVGQMWNIFSQLTTWKPRGTPQETTAVQNEAVVSRA